MPQTISTLIILPIDRSRSIYKYGTHHDNASSLVLGLSLHNSTVRTVLLPI